MVEAQKKITLSLGKNQAYWKENVFYLGNNEIFRYSWLIRHYIGQNYKFGKVIMEILDVKQITK